MDLYGKYNQDGPLFKDQVDYYFETREDFDARRDEIIAENNNDLSQKTFGFGDSVTSLEKAFEKTDITSTPKAIYGNNVTNFGNCFNYCFSLTTIQEGLFDNCPNVTDFSGCFYLCEYLITIPEGLFDNCPNVTDFCGCFNYCNSLTTIPKGLFDNCHEVTNFDSCFSNCYDLTTIPESLFNNCTKVTDFGYCFNYCKSLTTISEGLFDNCHEVTDFSYCFYGCAEITSALPDAWNKEKFPNVTDYNKYARDCTKVANYADIPEDWK